jgi:hypothetical protein
MNRLEDLWVIEHISTIYREISSIGEKSIDGVLKRRCREFPGMTFG